jgi:ketosteroid isomerase-like protein
MSQEDVDVVRMAYESFNAGAVEKWVAAFHPDVQVAARGVFPGIDRSYQGHAGVKQLRESVLEAWESFRIEPRDFADRGSCVDVEVDLIGKGKGSGVEVSLRFHHAFLLRDGLVVHWALFPTRAEALEAVGLSE